jgi:hypothetical protein
MLEETRLDYALVTVFVEVWISIGHVADCSWMTGNAEVIGSSFGLVPTNAHLVSAWFPNELPTCRYRSAYPILDYFWIADDSPTPSSFETGNRLPVSIQRGTRKREQAVYPVPRQNNDRL